jgi:hypothetical protein
MYRPKETQLITVRIDRKTVPPVYSLEHYIHTNLHCRNYKNVTKNFITICLFTVNI